MLCNQNMMRLYQEIATALEAAFSSIENVAPRPVVVQRGSYEVFRYKEKSVEAAIIQKCARLVSGINASLVLLKAGYVQELCALFRMLDEFREDIYFLCEAVRSGQKTELHEKYLDSFYQEEFDIPENPLLSSQNRPTIKREKIRAVISRISERELNPSDNQKLQRTLSQMYSGFVHAASTHVMDMYGGYPPRFQVSGMLGTPRITEAERNTWDYLYRGLITIMWVCHTFKQDSLLHELYQFRNYIEQQTNKTKWEPPESMIKRAKAKKT